MKIFALILFILMYVLMVVWPKYRPLWSLGTAVVFLLAGVLPLDGLGSVINWNVLMMIAGTMLIVHTFIASQMPNLLADLLLEKSKNVLWVTILMSLFSGAISALIDNVATVLMVAPVGLAICRKLNRNPVPMIPFRTRGRFFCLVIRSYSLSLCPRIKSSSDQQLAC